MKDENKEKAIFKIQDIARSATVTRWHSVNCLRYPSIAEHSYLVTMYAREILKRINPNATAEEKLLLLEYSCFHDLPEVLTGDMATPVKRQLESMFPEGQSPLDLIEEALCPEYKELKHEVANTYLAVIAKLADVLEAVKFIYVEGKSYIQRQDQNRQIVDSMKQLSSIMTDFCKTKDQSEDMNNLLAEKINSINSSFENILAKENSDYIYAILLERKTNFEERVIQAKTDYPEWNWDHASEVFEELLYGETSQIHFKDFNR
jgi:5'-deoxynucleotidase